MSIFPRITSLISPSPAAAHAPCPSDTHTSGEHGKETTELKASSEGPRCCCCGDTAK